MNDLVALYAAYIAIWAGLLGYVAYLHARQRRLERTLELVETELREHARKGTGR